MKLLISEVCLLANFTMIPGEKEVEKGVDRFNGIVQKLNRHNIIQNLPILS
jgi:hypothetical protein